MSFAHRQDQDVRERPQDTVYRFHLIYARVVKLVDTRDLKSLDHCDRAGSIPAPGTKSNQTRIIDGNKIQGAATSCVQPLT